MSDKPEANMTIINVKNVPAEAWEIAKKAANKQGETMGAWVGKALITQANLEAGPREFPPNPTANLDPKTVNPGPAAALAALATLAPVVAGLGPKLSRTAASDISAVISAFAREARGLPPRPRLIRDPKGLAAGKADLENGKTRLIEADLDANEGVIPS